MTSDLFRGFLGWSCESGESFCTGLWLCALIGQLFQILLSGDRLLAQGSSSATTSIHARKKQQHARSVKQFRPFFLNVSHPFTRRVADYPTAHSRKRTVGIVPHSSECLRTPPVAPQHQHILVTGRRAIKGEEAQRTARFLIIRMMQVKGEVSNKPSGNPEGDLMFAIESDGTYIRSPPARKKGFFKKLFGCTCVSVV